MYGQRVNFRVFYDHARYYRTIKLCFIANDELHQPLLSSIKAETNINNKVMSNVA